MNASTFTFHILSGSLLEATKTKFKQSFQTELARRLYQQQKLL
jgi:hypothetical protein